MNSPDNRHAKRIGVPVWLLTLYGCGIIWLWALFWWLPFFLVILYLTPLLLMLLVFVILLTRGNFLKWQVYGKPIALFVSTGIAVSLAFSIPMSSKQYGKSVAQRFVRELGLQVELVEQEVTIIERMLDDGPPRRVHSVYRLLEPRSAVQQKIRDRISREYGKAGNRSGASDLSSTGWQVGEIGTSAYCYSWDTQSNDVWIDQHEQLQVILLYNSSPYCKLQTR